MTPPLLDVTGSVRLDDAAATAGAVEHILVHAFGRDAVDCAALHAAFAHARTMYDGENPAYVACDLPYHDLRHALDTALCMARMVDGYRRDPARSPAFTPAHGLVAVLLALLHDSGFLRTRDEAHLTGAQLAAVHEARSAALAHDYLHATRLAPFADLTPLMFATRLATPTAQVLDARDEVAVAIGCMLGTADLVCQLADPLYIERCYHHLYAELVATGGPVPFRDARDLVARTPAFHTHVAAPRLATDLGGAVRHLAAHFDGDDRYARAIDGNVARAGAIAARGDWQSIGPPPPTTTRTPGPGVGAATAR